MVSRTGISPLKHAIAVPVPQMQGADARGPHGDQQRPVSSSRCRTPAARVFQGVVVPWRQTNWWAFAQVEALPDSLMTVPKVGLARMLTHGAGVLWLGSSWMMYSRPSR